MKAIYQSYERNAAMILAAERWADGYSETPDQLGRLIRASARLERKIFVHFKERADQITQAVNWYAYRHAQQEIQASRVDAYDVEVIVSDQVIEQGDSAFIQVVFEELAVATALGAQASEVTYAIPLGLDKTDAEIQRIVREQIANLVGKRIDRDGTLIDNPRAKYRISDKLRADIREAIKVSIDLGEDIPAATARLREVIRNPKRAELIAQTETVDAYNNGVMRFGRASGAVAKQWTDNGAVDVCAKNTQDGVIPLDGTFTSGHKRPGAHPRCRCYMRLVYQNELDQNPGLLRKA